MSSHSHQNRPVNRPRTKSGFSLRTSSSGSNSYKRASLQETPSEKHKAKMSQTTKANPNAAINEAQPIALALEKPTISSLTNIQCTDIYGNLITDPDRSNPTRWRMERPLDTIRSFEHAIDKGFQSRASVYAPQPGPLSQNGYQSQRSSMYWNNNNSSNVYDSNARSSSYGDNYFQQQRSNPRMQSDPMLNRYNSGQNGYQGQAASSSADLYNQLPENAQQYSYSPQEGYPQDENGYGQRMAYPPRQASQAAPNGSAPQLGNYGYGNAQPAGNGGYYQSSPNLAQQPLPRPPPKDSRPAVPTKAGPIRLNDPNPPAPKLEQRTNWLKKRFSRAK